MKFNKEYLVHINLDIPYSEKLGMTKEEFESSFESDIEAMSDNITAMLCRSLEVFKLVGAKYEIETSEVKHGKWIRKNQQWEQKTEFGNTYFSGTYPTCSICGGFECGVKQETNFCPNCGARMDGDMEEKTEENNEIL